MKAGKTRPVCATKKGRMHVAAEGVEFCRGGEAMTYVRRSSEIKKGGMCLGRGEANDGGPGWERGPKYHKWLRKNNTINPWGFI